MEHPQNPQPYLEIILAYLLGQPLPPTMQAKLLRSPEAQAMLLQLAQLIAHLDDPTWLEEVAAVSEGIPSETVAAFLAQREALRLLGPQAIERLEMLCTPPPVQLTASLRPAYPSFTQRWKATQNTRPMAPTRPPVLRRSRTRAVWALMAASVVLVMFISVFMTGVLSTAWVLSTNQLVSLESSTPTPTLHPTVALPAVLATATPQAIAIVASPTVVPPPTDTAVPPSATPQRSGVIQALPSPTPTAQALQPVAQLPTNTPTVPPTVAPSPTTVPTQPLPSPTVPPPLPTATHTPEPSFIDDDDDNDDDDDDDTQAPIFGVPPTPTIMPGDVPSRIDSPLLTPMENPVRETAPELEPVVETSSVAILESTVFAPLTVGVWHPETNQLDMGAAAVAEPGTDAIMVFDLSALTTLRTAELYLSPISGTVEALDVWLHPTEALSPTITEGQLLTTTESLWFDVSAFVTEPHSRTVVIRVQSATPVEWVGELVATAGE